MSKVEIQGLFPVPLMRVHGCAPRELIETLIARTREAATQQNSSSTRLHHSEMRLAEADETYRAVQSAVGPHMVEFGTLLFGEPLSWLIKEMWTNRLETGGAQTVHSHANSFISGVVYLTDTHPSARTVFRRDMGGREYVFSNANERARMGPFNATDWVSPPARAGDMVLFPSYLLHEVPRNEGGERMTLAFNAIPHRLDSWGYAVNFGVDG